MTPSQRLDVTFAALADPTRRATLGRLASGAASVMDHRAPECNDSLAELPVSAEAHA